MSIKGLYPSNEGPRIHENTCQVSAQIPLPISPRSQSERHRNAQARTGAAARRQARRRLRPSPFRGQLSWQFLARAISHAKVITLAFWTGKTPRQAACLKLNFKKWDQHGM